MKVNEIFLSIEGEGIRTGEFSTFIRLYGCNLRCKYCDTMYAVEGNEFIEMSPQEILEKVQNFKVQNITVTGGEPLIHKDIDKLFTILCEAGYKVNVETNGSIKPTFRHKNLFYTMDWKVRLGSGASCCTLPNTKERDLALERYYGLQKTDVIKFVVGNSEDICEAAIVTNFIRMKIGDDNMPFVYISPIFGKITPAEIVEEIRNEYITLKKFVRIQVQLHKIIWSPKMRGV